MTELAAAAAAGAEPLVSVLIPAKNETGNIGSLVAEVVADLEQAFATTGLEADVIAFLELARKQQWIDV